LARLIDSLERDDRQFALRHLLVDTELGNRGDAVIEETAPFGPRGDGCPGPELLGSDLDGHDGILPEVVQPGGVLVAALVGPDHDIAAVLARPVFAPVVVISRIEAPFRRPSVIWPPWARKSARIVSFQLFVVGIWAASRL
jgi:hypothetical protein